MEKQENENDLRVLTVDELRSYEGLGDLTEEQSLEIIKTLKDLSLLAHSILSNNGEIRTVSRVCKEEC